jgi:hypothetical protein
MDIHSISALWGSIKTICADGHISDDEVTLLNKWLKDNSAYRNEDSFNDLEEHIKSVLRDGRVSDVERNAMLHLLESVLEKMSFDDVISNKLKSARSISDCANGLLAALDITAAELCRRSNLNEQTFSRLTSGSPRTIEKKTVYALAIGAKLKYFQTLLLISKVGVAHIQDNYDKDFLDYIRDRHPDLDIDEINGILFTKYSVVLGSNRREA